MSRISRRQPLDYKQSVRKHALGLFVCLDCEKGHLSHWTMRSSKLKVGFTLMLSVVFRYSHGQQTGCDEDTVRSAMIEYGSCWNNNYRILFSLAYEDAGPYVVQQRCASINPTDCRDRTERRIGGCLDYNRRQSLEFTYHALDAGYRYWCSDYAQNLIDFYNRRGPNCYYMQQSSFGQCEMEYPISNPKLNEYTAEYCRIFDYVLNCMQQVYERCLPQENPDLTRRYYSAMWRATPCLYSQQSPLTSNAVSKDALIGLWIVALTCLLSTIITMRLLPK